MTKGWRLYLGVALMLYSALPYLALALLPFLGLPLAESGTFAIAFFATGEAAFLAAIALVGKDFIVSVKTRLMQLVKRPYRPRPISRARHRLGIVLLVLSLIPYYLVLVGELFTGAIAPPTVALILLAGELLFLIALLILGNPFWERLKQLFAYPEPTV